MDLSKKCSPDINNIDETIKLYEGKKISFIKSIILSGECDKQLLNISLSYPYIPILYFSGISNDVIMSEASHSKEFLFGDEAEQFLNELYDDNNYLIGVSRYLKMSPKDIHRNSKINIDQNGKRYAIDLFEENTEPLYDFSYAVYYRLNEKYDFIINYWKQLLRKHKREWKDALNDYTNEYEDGEEIVDIDDL